MEKKKQLGAKIKEITGDDVDPDAMFDIHVRPPPALLDAVHPVDVTSRSEVTTHMRYYQNVELACFCTIAKGYNVRIVIRQSTARKNERLACSLLPRCASLRS